MIWATSGAFLRDNRIGPRLAAREAAEQRLAASLLVVPRADSDVIARISRTVLSGCISGRVFLALSERSKLNCRYLEDDHILRRGGTEWQPREGISLADLGWHDPALSTRRLTPSRAGDIRVRPGHADRLPPRAVGRYVWRTGSVAPPASIRRRSGQVTGIAKLVAVVPWRFPVGHSGCLSRTRLC